MHGKLSAAASTGRRVWLRPERAFSPRPAPTSFGSFVCCAGGSVDFKRVPCVELFFSQIDAYLYLTIGWFVRSCFDLIISRIVACDNVGWEILVFVRVSASDRIWIIKSEMCSNENENESLLRNESILFLLISFFRLNSLNSMTRMLSALLKFPNFPNSRKSYTKMNDH